MDIRTITNKWRIGKDSERLPIIVGRGGHISAHDLETICVYIAGKYRIYFVLRKMPGGWIRHQIGDEEANILAPVSDVDIAAKFIKAYKRRHLSPEHKEALRGRLYVSPRKGLKRV